MTTSNRTHLVGYDLHKPVQNYPGLIDCIKGFGAWWHHLDSTWLVVTALSASELRDKLGTYIDGDDELLVIDVTGDSWASKGLTAKANDWLRQHVAGGNRG